VTQETPRSVLDKLGMEGYMVVTTTGLGQTCVWTCEKPRPKFMTPHQ